MSASYAYSCSQKCVILIVLYRLCTWLNEAGVGRQDVHVVCVYKMYIPVYLEPACSALLTCVFYRVYQLG